MNYDQNNVFARIIRKELPADIVDENKYALAFKDISPQAPVHILIIPKKNYITFDDFTSLASKEEIINLYKLINSIILKFKLQNYGYRLITNSGEHGNQEVKHLHFHLLGGRNLGVMLS